MLSNLRSLVGAAADTVGGTRNFGQLAVRERVIDTGSETGGRTIAVQNISTISIAKIDKRLARILLWISAVAIGLYGIVWLAMLGDLLTALVAIAVSAGLVWMATRAKDIVTLSIGTNDGSRSLYTSADEAFLKEVKNFLTEKINTGDQRVAVFNIDQSRRELTIGSVTGPVTVGSNNQVAAQSPNARFGTTETYAVEHSPGAQVGSGNVAVGTRVDYSSVLPNVEQWHRHALQTQGWEHVAERLADLEALLKSGTPSKEDKGKVRSLVTDLSTILQGYPAAVQLFGAVSRLAGL